MGFKAESQGSEEGLGLEVVTVLGASSFTEGVGSSEWLRLQVSSLGLLGFRLPLSPFPRRSRQRFEKGQLPDQLLGPVHVRDQGGLPST